MKLSKTTGENSYRYLWLLSKIFPYIKPYMGRIIIGFMIAIPLGLLDGVVAFSLKPYMMVSFITFLLTSSFVKIRNIGRCEKLLLAYVYVYVFTILHTDYKGEASR